MDRPSECHRIIDNCWFQLAAGIVAMVAITNLQYGWTLFVKPLGERFHWTNEAIQWGFTLFVLAETWLVPFEGYLVDRFGPRPLMLVGGVLVSVSWISNSGAESLMQLYVGNALGGVGAGIVYGTSLGNALKWFPHRRGLAAGLTAAAFGAGSALTVTPLDSLIRSAGYQTAFSRFGIVQGAVVVGCALLIRAPGSHGLAADSPPRIRQSRRHFAWREMIAQPLFWLMYAIIALASVGGLMAQAQIAPMATDYGVANTQISLWGFTRRALPLALVLDRVLNGLSRPFFGWISDRLGRENTMFIAFSLEACAIFLLVRFAHDPVSFVILTGLTFFAWGEIFSLFPALSADLFGTRFATVNYGLLYTAKGAAALLVPRGNAIRELTHSWAPVFYLAMGFDIAAALLAFLVLKPSARRWLTQVESGKE